ncbi:MAG: hypothetical protein JNL09_02165 [Anaerolineales bacterium]|nr:hypothetical protein [Anaerolineales bacterium]
MKKRRTPQEKKQLSLSKDHVVLAEYPHAFRKSWPKKKARANQVYRHKIRQALSTQYDVDRIDLAESAVKAIVRKPIQKWDVVSLGERVNNKLEVRRSRLGWNFFRQPYSSVADRERFVAFLSALIVGRSAESFRLARVVAEWLAPPHHDISWHKLEEKQRWLTAFFKDEPTWEKRLHKWIAEMLSKSETHSKS